MSKKPKISTSTPSKAADEHPVAPSSPDSPSTPLPDDSHNTAFVSRKRLDEAEEELRRQAQKQNDL